MSLHIVSHILIIAAIPTIGKKNEYNRFRKPPTASKNYSNLPIEFLQHSCHLRLRSFYLFFRRHLLIVKKRHGGCISRKNEVYVYVHCNQYWWSEHPRVAESLVCEIDNETNVQRGNRVWWEITQYRRVGHTTKLRNAYTARFGCRTQPQLRSAPLFRPYQSRRR